MTRQTGTFGLVPSLMVAVSLACLASGSASAGPVTMPALFPTPTSIELGSGTIALGRSVSLIAAPGVDPDTIALVRSILTASGVKTITTARRLPSVIDGTYVVLGTAAAPIVRDALARSRAVADNHAEGYTIASLASASGGVVTLAGHDADGLFHAAQTFRQLARRSTIPALVIQDHPAMPIRGTIEGFYGAPWSMADRTKHLDFLATVKANTYVLSLIHISEPTRRS